MTDEKWYFLSVHSLNNVWAKKKAELTISHSCKNDITKIYLSHPYLIGNGPIDIRLDNEPKVSEYAQSSQSKKILFIGDESVSLGTLSSGHPKNLIKKWEDHKKLLVQYENIAKAKEIAEFNIEGLKTQFAKRCQ